jgi:2-dehydropantoate 2-reductase
MHIILVGPGAIGALYAAKLAKTHDVTLLARPAHAAAINERGILIKGRDAGTVRVNAAASIDTLAPDALIILTTKVNDSEIALAPLVPLLSPGVTILCVQNGLYSEAVVREFVHDRAVVLRAITQFGAILEAPGVVDFTVPGYTLIEEHPRAATIAAVLTEAGLDGRVTAQMKREMWHKLIFNCVVNPVTAILGTKVGRIADPALDPLKQLVLDECVAVARADGVDFEEDLLSLLNKRFGGSRNIASMRQDLIKGRKTEIDYLNHAVAELGQRLGIDCPVNRALTAMVRYLETQGERATAPGAG